jgi:D-alanyl-D-alanine carboxypeptidase
MSSVLEAHLAAGEFVGARIALLDRDGSVSEVAAGTTSVDPTSGTVDLDVAWNVGSVTKMFVAVVVMQLAEEGRIDLDGGIDAFMPTLSGADRITPRHLLQHTSGLAEYGNQAAVLTDAQREWMPAELLAVAEAAGRAGEPGSGYHYSNTNYIVLGEIIEQVTGNAWDDEVRTRIVEPLGLTNTSAIRDEQPIGYKIADGAFVDSTSSTHPSLGGAAGGMQSTGRDLLRFVVGITDGSLLSAQSQLEMQTFVTGDDLSELGTVHGYGLGLEQYATDTVTVIGHMGTGEAQSAFLGYDAEHGTAVAVMTNTAIPGPQAIMAVETLIAVSEAP